MATVTIAIHPELKCLAVKEGEDNYLPLYYCVFHQSLARIPYIESWVDGDMYKPKEWIQQWEPLTDDYALAPELEQSQNDFETLKRELTGENQVGYQRLQLYKFNGTKPNEGRVPYFWELATVESSRVADVDDLEQTRIARGP